MISQDSLPGIYRVGQIESLVNENPLLILKNLLAVNGGMKARFEQRLTTNLPRIAELMQDLSAVAVAPAGQLRFHKLDELRLQYATNIVQVGEALTLDQLRQPKTAIHKQRQKMPRSKQ